MNITITLRVDLEMDGLPMKKRDVKEALMDKILEDLPRGLEINDDTILFINSYSAE